MKLLISGGGTGGHIYPAIAIIEEFKKRYPDLELLYIGTENSMEERVAYEQAIPFKSIRVRGLPRRLNADFFKSLYELIHGLVQAGRLVKEFDPDVVVGTGGFVTGPVLLRAALMRYKTAIHEQNSLPGVANRLLSRFVDLALLTYDSSKRFFKGDPKMVVTGNPIRLSMSLDVDREEAFKKFKLKEDLPVIFVFGGSNGSVALNDSALDLVNHHRDLDFQIIHSTGRGHYEDFENRLEHRTPLLSYHPYIDDMASAYAISDLVVTSSGAITLTELSILKKPSILIPKAYTTENHQEYNALQYVEAGASEMILESELSGDMLYNSIRTILDNKGALEAMSANVAHLANPRASQDIVDQIEELLKER